MEILRQESKNKVPEPPKKYHEAICPTIRTPSFLRKRRYFENYRQTRSTVSVKLPLYTNVWSYFLQIKNKHKEYHPFILLLLVCGSGAFATNTLLPHAALPSLRSPYLRRVALRPRPHVPIMTQTGKTLARARESERLFPLRVPCPDGQQGRSCCAVQGGASRERKSSQGDQGV